MERDLGDRILISELGKTDEPRELTTMDAKYLVVNDDG
jgi:hypothetical protein